MRADRKPKARRNARLTKISFQLNKHNVTDKFQLNFAVEHREINNIVS